MHDQEKLLSELGMKINSIISKYESMFRQSDCTLDEFLKENFNSFKREVARVATDIIHDSISNGVNTDKNFIPSIQRLTQGSDAKLKLTLKKK